MYTGRNGSLDFDFKVFGFNNKTDKEHIVQYLYMIVLVSCSASGTHLR